ncbi:hypothetical protein EDB92DRAFT_1795220, partial [Lactarius akahatsu]
TYDHALRAQMLYSLGSTLTTETIDPFFTPWNKNPQTDKLTYPEAIRCLKIETCRPMSKRSPYTGRTETFASTRSEQARTRPPDAEPPRPWYLNPCHSGPST